MDINVCSMSMASWYCNIITSFYKKWTGKNLYKLSTVMISNHARVLYKKFS